MKVVIVPWQKSAVPYGPIDPSLYERAVEYIRSNPNGVLWVTGELPPEMWRELDVWADDGGSTPDCQPVGGLPTARVVSKQGEP